MSMRKNYLCFQFLQKASKNKQFSWNNQHRVGNFIEGFFTENCDYLKITIVYLNWLFNFFKPWLYLFDNHLKNQWVSFSIFDNHPTLVLNFNHIIKYERIKFKNLWLNNHFFFYFFLKIVSSLKFSKTKKKVFFYF